MSGCMTDDDEYSYEKGILDVYLKKTSTIVKDQEIIGLHLPKVVNQVLQGHEGPHFKVLSIGCGDGRMDRYIANIIKEELQRHERHKNTKIFNRAIDPNDYSLRQYKANINRLNEDDQVISYSVAQKTFQELKEEQMCNPEEEKFDIVHFMHSIYYVDPEEALAYCFENLLRENGQVVCLAEGYNLVYSSVVANSIEVRQRKPFPYESYVDELRCVAEKRGWKVCLHMQEYSIDVTEIFDETSKEGNMLLDFMTQVKNFRAETKKEKVSEVLKLIKESSEETANGKRLSKRFDGFMSISK